MLAWRTSRVESCGCELGSRGQAPFLRSVASRVVAVAAARVADSERGVEGRTGASMMAPKEKTMSRWRCRRRWRGEEDDERARAVRPGEEHGGGDDDRVPRERLKLDALKDVRKVKFASVIDQCDEGEVPAPGQAQIDEHVERVRSVRASGYDSRSWSNGVFLLRRVNMVARNPC